MTPSVVVEIGEIGADAAQMNKMINRPQQSFLRDVILKRELVAQRRLRLLSRSRHH